MNWYHTCNPPLSYMAHWQNTNDAVLDKEFQNGLFKLTNQTSACLILSFCTAVMCVCLLAHLLYSSVRSGWVGWIVPGRRALGGNLLLMTPFKKKKKKKKKKKI